MAKKEKKRDDKNGGEKRQGKERIGDETHGAPYLPPGGVSAYMGDAPEWEHLAQKRQK